MYLQWLIQYAIIGNISNFIAEILTVWGKNPQFTINLAQFNRLPLHPQVNDILGDFTSVILLAVDNSHPESFSDRSRRLQQQLWQDLEHRYLSGVRVTRELAHRKGTSPSAMPVVFTSTLGFSSLGQKTLTFSHFGELVYGISQASQANFITHPRTGERIYRTGDLGCYLSLSQSQSANQTAMIQTRGWWDTTMQKHGYRKRQILTVGLDDGVAYNYTRFKGLVYEGADLKIADLEKASQWKSDLLKQKET